MSYAQSLYNQMFGNGAPQNEPPPQPQAQTPQAGNAPFTPSLNLGGWLDSITQDYAAPPVETLAPFDYIDPAQRAGEWGAGSEIRVPPVTPYSSVGSQTRLDELPPSAATPAPFSFSSQDMLDQLQLAQPLGTQVMQLPQTLDAVGRQYEKLKTLPVVGGILGKGEEVLNWTNENSSALAGIAKVHADPFLQRLTNGSPEEVTFAEAGTTEEELTQIHNTLNEKIARGENIMAELGRIKEIGLRGYGEWEKVNPILAIGASMLTDPLNMIPGANIGGAQKFRKVAEATKDVTKIGEAMQDAPLLARLWDKFAPLARAGEGELLDIAKLGIDEATGVGDGVGEKIVKGANPFSAFQKTPLAKAIDFTQRAHDWLLPQAASEGLSRAQMVDLLDMAAESAKGNTLTDALKTFISDRKLTNSADFQRAIRGALGYVRDARLDETYNHGQQLFRSIDEWTQTARPTTQALHDMLMDTRPFQEAFGDAEKMSNLSANQRGAFQRFAKVLDAYESGAGGASKTEVRAAVQQLNQDLEVIGKMELASAWVDNSARVVKSAAKLPDEAQLAERVMNKIRAYESALLLAANPHYVAQNVVSDWVRLAMHGVNPMESAQDISNLFGRAFGTGDMRDVMGEIGSALKNIDQKYIPNAPLGLSVPQKFGKLPVIKQLGDFNQLMNERSRVRAFYTGFVRAYKANWKYGTTLPRMPAVLEQAILNAGGERALKSVVKKLERSFNAQEMRDALKQPFPMWEAYADTIAPELETALAKHGINLKLTPDALEYLISHGTGENVNAVIERAFRRAQTEGMENFARIWDEEAAGIRGKRAQWQKTVDESDADLFGGKGKTLDNLPSDEQVAEHGASNPRAFEQPQPGKLRVEPRPAPGAQGGVFNTSEQGASIPVIITKKMENDLRVLGYGDAAINKMTPQEANGILVKGTRASATDVPNVLKHTVTPEEWAQMDAYGRQTLLERTLAQQRDAGNFPLSDVYQAKGDVPTAMSDVSQLPIRQSADLSDVFKVAAQKGVGTITESGKTYNQHVLAVLNKHKDIGAARFRSLDDIRTRADEAYAILDGYTPSQKGAFPEEIGYGVGGDVDLSLLPPMQQAVGLDEAQRAVESKYIQDVTTNLGAYLEKYGAKFGNFVSVDTARELFPEYLNDPLRYTAATGTPAYGIAQAYYRKLLGEPMVAGRNTVVFLVGGAGSGKSTAVEAVGLKNLTGEAEIVFEKIWRSSSQAGQDIQEALDAGRKVQVFYAHRPIENAASAILVRTVEKKRIAPVDRVASGHFYGQETILQLPEMFKDKNVAFRVIDNSGKIEDARIVKIDTLREPSVRYASVEDVEIRARKAIEDEYNSRAGTSDAIPDEIYFGNLGRGAPTERGSSRQVGEPVTGGIEKGSETGTGATVSRDESGFTLFQDVAERLKKPEAVADPTLKADVETALADELLRILRPVMERDMGNYGRALDLNTLNLLESYIADAEPAMNDMKNAAQQIGRWYHQHTAMDYSQRWNVDDAMNFVAPFTFYPLHMAANFGQDFLDKPALFAMYTHLQNEVDKQSKDLPARFQHRIKIPMPFLPDWMGDGVFVDPFATMFPARQVFNLDDLERATFNSQNSDSQQGKPLDNVSLLTDMYSPHLPYKLGYQFLTGDKESLQDTIANLPPMRMLKAAGAPYDLSIAGFKPLQGKWDEYYLQRAARDAVADGTIDEKQMKIALLTRKGETWEKIVERSRLQNYTAPVLSGWTGFTGKVHPAGEIKYNNARMERDRLEQQLLEQYGASPNLTPEQQYEFLKSKGEYDGKQESGVGGKMRAFLDEHPELEGGAAKGDTEQMYRDYLKDGIWEQWQGASALQKKLWKSELGEPFASAFMNKDTRAYDEIPTPTLLGWANALKVNLPDVTADLQTTPEPYQVTFPTKQQQAAYDTFRADVEKSVGWENYYAWNEYYQQLKQTDKQAASGYLKSTNGQKLIAVWDAQDEFYKQNPGIQTMLEKAGAIAIRRAEEKTTAAPGTQDAQKQAWGASLNAVGYTNYDEYKKETDEYFALPKGSQARRDYLAIHPRLARQWAASRAIYGDENNNANANASRNAQDNARKPYTWKYRGKNYYTRYANRGGREKRVYTISYGDLWRQMGGGGKRPTFTRIKTKWDNDRFPRRIAPRVTGG